MTQRFAIDTSVLVRLLTAEPQEAFTYCLDQLSELVMGGAEVFASNQVIGEAFIAVQHHYGVSAVDARIELSKALRSGLVSPLNGPDILEALAATGGPGLFDRLIANDYTKAGLGTLTLDQRMSALPGAQRL